MEGFSAHQHGGAVLMGRKPDYLTGFRPVDTEQR
jgi:hypothetical protein